MNSYQSFTIFLILFFNISIKALQPSTLEIKRVVNAPIFDAQSTDAVWDSASWVAIDQVWKPWGTTIDSADFYGRFKVLWSSKTNLLYFFVDITDDVFINQADQVEIFIDENKSGGNHVFDGYDFVNNNTISCPSCNAENAFSYHIKVDAPANGSTTTTKYVRDIAGAPWNDADYTNHFPNYIMKKVGNRYYYEFSLKVYSDVYVNNNPEASRVVLTEGKISGLTLAYNEYDVDANTRTSFIGSVAGDASKLTTENGVSIYNMMWINADKYGTVKFIAPVTGVSLSASNITIEKGSNTTLTATVLPSDATNKQYSFSSDDTNIATVNATTGKVVAVNKGTANITVKTADGNKIATCKVTVIIKPNSVSITPNKVSMYVDESTKLSVEVLPANANTISYSLYSDNKSVATVDNSGNVKAISAGNARIIVVTDEGKLKDTTNVTVLNIPVTDVSLLPASVSINKGQSVKLTYTVSPSTAFNQSVTFSSDDENIASVDIEGNVLGVNAGKTNVIIKTIDGEFKDTTELTVVSGASISNATNNKFIASIISNKLNIELNNSFNGTAKLNVYNILGMQLYAKNIMKQGELLKQNFNIELASGVYIVQLNTGLQTYTSRIVIR